MREIHDYLAASHSSLRALAGELGVQPSTLSRSVATNAFSRDLAQRIRARLRGEKEVDGRAMVVRKALHLLSRSDKLRVRAEKLLKVALDHEAQAK